MEYRTDGLERRAHRRICADEFAQWWRDLTEAQQEDVTAIALLLMEQGPKLPFPYSSGITGSKHAHMRELRVQSGGLPIPGFFSFYPPPPALLLIRGDKTRHDPLFTHTIPTSVPASSPYTKNLKKKAITPRPP